jgi:acyl-CoA reductase-like NAD-dependent aldehyde dehydrogenase
MDERIEELYKAVLSEQGKPWGEMRREVRQHVVDVEQAVREATELQLNDSDNELAVRRFRHQFRERMRVAHEAGRASSDTAKHLREVLKILTEDRRFNWPRALPKLRSRR